MGKSEYFHLRPEHFGSRRGIFRTSHVSFSQRGLELSCGLDAQDRDCEWLTWHGTDERRAAKLERFANDRPATQITCNPAHLPAAELKKKMAASRGRRAAEVGGYGLHDSYDLEWNESGQSLVLVAFGEDMPVGYAAVDVTTQYGIHPKTVHLRIEAHAVHVQPSYRGRGYGIDLSIAAGWVAEDVYTAMYRAVRSGWSLESTVYADYESKGGQSFTEQIKSALDVRTDLLNEVKQRPSVKVEHPILDAGF